MTRGERVRSRLPPVPVSVEIPGPATLFTCHLHPPATAPLYEQRNTRSCWLRQLNEGFYILVISITLEALVHRSADMPRLRISPLPAPSGWPGHAPMRPARPDWLTLKKTRRYGGRDDICRVLIPVVSRDTVRCHHPATTCAEAGIRHGCTEVLEAGKNFWRASPSLSPPVKVPLIDVHV